MTSPLVSEVMLRSHKLNVIAVTVFKTRGPWCAVDLTLKLTDAAFSLANNSPVTKRYVAVLCDCNWTIISKMSFMFYLQLKHEGNIH